MRRFATSLGSLTLALGLAASTLPAQVAYTNRSAFQAALSSFTTEGFEGIAPPGTFVDFFSGPLVAGPFTISTTNCCSDILVIDDAYAGGAFSLGSGATLSPQIFGGTNDIDVSAAGGIQAFGFDYGVSGAPTTFSLFLDGVFFQSFSYGSTLPTPEFFGFVSNTTYSTVTIRADNDVAIYDNFTVGTPMSAVPEPATVALLGFGVLALGGIARRRRTTG
jgi:hypothetical protein